MSSYVNIPLINPFKIVPSNANMKIYANHFDLRWFKDQKIDAEMVSYYKQKWQKSDTTPVQIESTIPPAAVKIYDASGTVVKTINWTTLYLGVNYNIYQFIFDISDKAEGTYFFSFLISNGGFNYEFVSEPIWSKVYWPDTMSFVYWNSFNDFDVAFTLMTDHFLFRCEACLPASQMVPKRNATAYANQNNMVRTLSGIPVRSFQLYVGGTGSDVGVAPYVLDILDRALDCDNVFINGKKFAANVNAEWKKTDIPRYMLVSGSIEVFEADNQMSLQFSDTTPLPQGVVFAYNVETDFWGAATILPITEVQENS